MPVDEIAEGEQVVVRPGEVVPVDGTLESAAGELDESSLTGESLPVERVAGDVVLSGGVNGSVPLTLRVLRPARESQYQQIVALVAEASASRAPMVRLADRYAIPFTVLSLTIAGVAWWWSGDAVRFAEVTSRPATRENAAWMLPAAERALHFSPEPRVITRVIESAVLLGQDDLALAHLARFRAAFPAAHRQWAEDNARMLEGVREPGSDADAGAGLSSRP